MYPFKWLIDILKGVVKNLAKPKISIVECTICKEVATWYSEYITNAKEIKVLKLHHIDRLKGKCTLGGKVQLMENLKPMK